jgi:hypothetical protein
VARTMVFFGIAGGLVGLVGSILLVLARLRSGDRVYHSADVSDAGINVLGNLSYDEAIDADNETINSREHQSIRVGLLSRATQRPDAILYGTVGDTHRRAIAAVGVARSLAAARVNVVVVDGSGDPHGLSERLGYENRKGVSHALEGQPIGPLLIKFSDRVQILAAGRPDGSDEDLLLTPRFHEVMDDVRERADIVLVVAGPLTEPRARALARETSFCVAESREGEVRLSDLEVLAEASTPGRHDRLSEQASGLHDLAGMILIGTPSRRRRREASSRS